MEFKKIILLVICILPLVYTQNSTTNCQIFISNPLEVFSNNSNSSNNSSSTEQQCGSLDNQCSSLSQGIESCFNQNLTMNMEFIFGTGTFYFNTNETVQLGDIYTNQNIKMIGSGESYIDLSGISGPLFSISEGESNNKGTFNTSFYIGNLNFKNSNTTGFGGIFSASVEGSLLNITIESSSFSNITGCTLFSINVYNEQSHYVPLSFRNVVFSNISQVGKGYSAIIKSTGSVSTLFSYCNFTNIVSYYSIGQFSYADSLLVLNSTFDSCSTNDEYGSLFYLYMQYGIITPNIFLFQDNVFSNNKLDSVQQNYFGSIISGSLAGQVIIINSSFINNSLTSLSFVESYVVITNSSFNNNNLVNSPLIIDYSSFISISSSKFIDNLLSNTGSNSYSLFTVNDSAFNLTNSKIISNNLPLFNVSHHSVVLINNIEISTSGITKFDLIDSCSNSTITINGEITNLDSSNTSINCSNQCALVSLNNDYKCNNSSGEPHPYKKPNTTRNIIIGVSVSVGLLLLIIIIVVAVRRHRHHHYQLIN